MTIKVILQAKQAGQQLVHGVKIAQDRIVRSVAATMRDAAAEILKRGRADIRAGGNFRKRWTDALHADPVQTSTASIINVFHTIPYFRVFEFGATIKGKPLLWIPLKFARDAKGVRARDYPGRLFRVDRSGKAPLLLSVTDKKPKYFGKAQVRIPRKFHIRTIAAEVSRQLRDFYSRHFRSEAGG